MKGKADITDQGVKLSAENTKSKYAEILRQLDEEQQPPRSGLRCPKCGGVMAHYRLYGYRCIRGCA